MRREMRSGCRAKTNCVSCCAARLLERTDDSHRVEIEFAGERSTFEHPQPEDAYALALLHVLRRIA